MSQDVMFLKYINEKWGVLTVRRFKKIYIVNAGEFHGYGLTVSEAIANLALNSQEEGKLC